MKKLIFLVLFFTIFSNCFSQYSPVTASKVTSYGRVFGTSFQQDTNTTAQSPNKKGLIWFKASSNTTVINGNVKVGGTLVYDNPTLIHRYLVGTKGHFTDIKTAVDWLNINATTACEILLDGGEHFVTNTITINNPNITSLRGVAALGSCIHASTGLTNKPIFTINSECYFDKIAIDGSELVNYGNLSTENAINVTASGIYFDFQNSNIKGCYDQIKMIGASSSLFAFNSRFTSPVNSSICVASTGTTEIDVEVNTFTDCLKSVFLQRSSDGNFDIMNNLFNNIQASNTCVVYTPASYTVHTHSSITGNKWNNIGNFYSGFDFTRSDGRDANVYVSNNANKEDKKPHYKINVLNNVTATTITTANTYYKANFTNTSSYTTKFTIANNKATYQSIGTTDVVVWVSGNIQVNNNNRNVNVCIIKNNNGVPIAPFTVRLPTSGESRSFSLVCYIEDVTINDYLELFVTSSTNGDQVTIDDLSLFAKAQ